MFNGVQCKTKNMQSSKPFRHWLMAYNFWVIHTSVQTSYMYNVLHICKHKQQTFCIKDKWRLQYNRTLAFIFLGAISLSTPYVYMYCSGSLFFFKLYSFHSMDWIGFLFLVHPIGLIALYAVVRMDGNSGRRNQRPTSASRREESEKISINSVMAITRKCYV